MVTYGTSPALPEILVGGLDHLAKATRNAPLRSLVKGGVDGESLLEAVRRWLAEMPSTHRAEWLLDRLSAAGNLTWQAQPIALGDSISSASPLGARRQT